MIKVIGFSTMNDKPHGKDGIVYLKEAERFTCAEPPTESAMRTLAIQMGYKLETSGKFGRCEPVYVYVDPAP